MRPHISQSVGTSQTLARHRGQRKPSLLISEWQTQRLGGEASGSRVGNPISMRSPGGLELEGVAPEARDEACWAGGGTSSKRRSL